MLFFSAGKQRDIITDIFVSIHIYRLNLSKEGFLFVFSFAWFYIYNLCDSNVTESGISDNVRSSVKSLERPM